MLTYAYCVVTSYLMTLKREEGQGMVEYGLLLGLIAAGVIGILVVLGPAIAAKFEEINTAIGGAAPAGG